MKYILRNIHLNISTINKYNRKVFLVKLRLCPRCEPSAVDTTNVMCQINEIAHQAPANIAADDRRPFYARTMDPA